MVLLIDVDRRIIRLKVVYYGPAVSGKNTNAFYTVPGHEI